MSTRVEFEIFARSEEYETREYTEDGDIVIGERAWVIAEAPDGRRWIHSTTFTGYRGEAIRRADALAERIRRAIAAGKWMQPASPVWSEADPCYGSDAYARNWRRYEARASLRDGEFEPGSLREQELRVLAE